MPSIRITFEWVATAAALASSAGAQPTRFADLHRMLPWEPSVAAHAIAAGDLDGDGNVDFLLGYDQPAYFSSPGGQQDRLLLNEGSGRFTDATGNLPPILDSTHGLALGDVDGDGDLDALIVNDAGGSGPSQFLLNDGSGVFSPAPMPLPPGVTPGYGGALGDVDGDGDLDAAIAGALVGIGLLLNDGAGVFTDASAQVPPLSGSTLAVALGDLDGDGDLDAFVGGLLDRPLLNDGTGVFALGPAVSQPSVNYTLALALGDVDGDGALDAVSAKDSCSPVGTCQGGQNRLYVNNGSGGFMDFTAHLPAAIDRTASVTLGDVDGDGDLDMLFGNLGACSADFGGCGYGEDRLYLNDGAGSFADASGQLPDVDDQTRAVALADVEGDGDLDALLGTDGDEGLPNRLLLNDGAGVFAEASGPGPASAFESAVTAVALGDLDGDGDLDAFVGRRPLSQYYTVTAPCGVFLNDGNGCLTAAPTSLSPTLYANEVALGDVDGDGDLDAMVADGFEGASGLPRLYLNDGAAGFTNATSQMAQVLGAGSDVALGDLDADGDLDALFGVVPAPGTPTNPHRVYLNSGSGFFLYLPAATPSSTLTVRAVALGDVDGDGDLDVYLGTGGACPSPSACSGQLDRLLLNNGVGVFAYAPPSAIPIVNDPTFAVALGDVDGDGDLDALVGNGGYATPALDRLLLNGGAGTFVDASSQLPLANDATPGVALGDVEGDGDLDALFGASPENRFLLNDGAGVYSDASSQLAGSRGSALDAAFGDMDGDGDLDAVLADSGELRILSNLTRQLAWRALPRIGKPVTFDLYGPAWGAWFLVASAGTGNTPIPPLGVIRLDLATLMPQFGGLLDAQGHVAVTYQVPAVPALVGQSLYWQAVVVGPARLTNLETTTFTNL